MNKTSEQETTGSGFSGQRHSRSRSRSRERDAELPRRQLRSHTRAAAAIQVAHANDPQSISRLHDDELACVLPFLPLKDLTQLVRCSHRFNGVTRKERSRELRLEGSSNIVPVVSSSLCHHVAAVHLGRRRGSDAQLTRDVLRQLRGLPKLTKLQFTLSNDAAVDHFMQGLSLETAANALRAILPSQLRSFSVTLGANFPMLNKRSAALASIFWAGLSGMTQLTELHVEQYSEYMHVRPELAGLTHLRKLTLGPAGQLGEHVAELKQLSQLRELTLFDRSPQRLRLLCQPPHALQLETIQLRWMKRRCAHCNTCLR
jgi:hypothetical protein